MECDLILVIEKEERYIACSCETRAWDAIADSFTEPAQPVSTGNKKTTGELKKTKRKKGKK